MRWTHIDAEGRARMVDVTEKNVTVRVAVARGRITMRPETLAMIVEKRVAKGDVYSVARVAGIMAAKKTPDLVPMCHPLNISSVEVSLTPAENPPRVEIEAVAHVPDGAVAYDRAAADAGRVPSPTII